MQNAACIRFNNHAICLAFILRGRTNQCILTYIPNGADARAVRPYMPLACKSFFDIANPKVQCSKFNVQGLPILKVKVQTSNFKVSQSKSSMFKVQTSKPANPKGQCSMVNVQSQSSYMPVMAILIRKMVEMESCASACRDARLVRPLKMLRAFVSTTMLFACHSPCADAGTDIY